MIMGTNSIQNNAKCFIITPKFIKYLIFLCKDTHFSLIFAIFTNKICENRLLDK